MDEFELEVQTEVDRTCLIYVREMQTMAEVNEAPILAFVGKRYRYSTVRIRSRLQYLVSKGWLAIEKKFVRGLGDVSFYTCTATGSDVLDGALPWE